MKFSLNRSAKGFTLIELLVVIAIIAILSTVVLASLTQARNRALAAKVTSQMAQIPAAVELAITTGTYPTSNNCTVLPWTDTLSGLSKLVTGGTGGSYPGTAVVNCYSTATSYAVVVSASVPAATFYCVDSLGQVKSTATSLAGAVNTGTATCI